MEAVMRHLPDACEAAVLWRLRDAEEKMEASLINRLILAIKRGESPTARLVKRLLRNLLSPMPPRLPRVLKPVLRVAYELHFLAIVLLRFFLNFFYRNPLFQARCAAVGSRLVIEGMPYVSGHVEIYLGDDVTLGGNISILSGRMLDRPRLVIGSRSGIGWNSVIAVNREIVLEDDAWVSYDCRISDSDGHPRRAAERIQAAPPDLSEIRPVRICRYAWVGNGCHIMKGVTIGEGAIIGANSVVITDIPPYCVAMGNPAEVYFRNVGRSRDGGADDPSRQTA
jgi:carbonic anhydrase/acetyltransferase-like protein (isoleucine patch superfamily)